jgi:hypothetical protein
MTDSSFDRDFEALRDDYRRKLLRELASLEDRIQRARASGARARDLAAACALAHRLMGTAGSYGFDACSEALAGIERHLDVFDDLGEPASEPRWPEIDSALARARAAVA